MSGNGHKKTIEVIYQSMSITLWVFIGLYYDLEDGIDVGLVNLKVFFKSIYKIGCRFYRKVIDMTFTKSIERLFTMTFAECGRFEYLTIYHR